MSKIDAAREKVKQMLDQGYTEDVIDGWLAQNNLTPDDLKASTDYSAADVARSTAQGLTFGFGDEMEAGVRSMFSDKTYKQERDKIRGDIERFRKHHPAKAIASELAGGALTGGLGVGRTLAKKGVEMGTKNLMKIGATEGAVAGAGYADELSDIPMNVGIGAVTGGVAGGALGLGAEFIKQFVKGSPKSQAGRQVLEALKADEMTPDQAIAKLRELGDDAILADVSPNLRGIARGATNQQGASKTAAQEVLDARQKGQQQRLVQASEQATGLKGEPMEAIDRLMTARTQKANELYDIARQKPVNVTPDMGTTWYNHPKAHRKAAEWYKGRTGIDVKNISADDLMQLDDLQYWDLWKRAMDDQISTAVRAGSGNEASYLKEARKSVLNAIDTDEYKAARKAFEIPTKMIDAVEDGKRIFNTKYAEELARKVDKLSPDERKAFTVGALRELRYRINRGVESANQARNLIKSPDFVEKMRNVFPDDKSFKEFYKVLENEARMAETYSIVHPNMNSKTAGVLAEQRALGQGIAPLVDLLRGDVGQAVGGAARNLGGHSALMPQNVNQELAKLMFTQGARNVQPLMQSALTPAQLSNLIAPTGLGLLNVGNPMLNNRR